MPLAAAVVARQRHFLAVTDQIRRVVAVCVHLIVVTEEDIEAVILRHAGRTAPAAAPLAKTTGGIAGLLQQGGDGHFAGAQRRAATVGPNRGVAAVLAGHQHTTSWRTQRGTGQALCEAHPFGGQLIDVGSVEVRMAHVREFVVAQFVRHDVDDVGLGVGVRVSVGRRTATQQQGAKGRYDPGSGPVHRYIPFSLPACRLVVLEELAPAVNSTVES